MPGTTPPYSRRTWWTNRRRGPRAASGATVRMRAMGPPSAAGPPPVRARSGSDAISRGTQPTLGQGDPVRVSSDGELFPVRLLLQRRRQGATGGRLTRLDDELLDAARDHDEQHPAAGGADRVAVRDVTRAEEVVTGFGFDRRVAYLEGRAPLEEPEALSLPVMDVQRRLGAGWLRDLDDRHLTAGVSGGCLDHRQAPEPPACLPLVRADGYRLQPLWGNRLLGHDLLPSVALLHCPEDDCIAPTAIVATVHHIDALICDDERGVAGHEDTPRIGDIGAGSVWRRQCHARDRLTAADEP